MTKAQRIAALEIAQKYEIRVINTWWDPLQNVAWSVLYSKSTLSNDQYYYLSHNKFLQVKEEPKQGEVVILTISELGKAKLLSLKQ